MKSKSRSPIRGKPTKRKAKKVPVLQAKSNSTGIVHFFGNPKEWSNVIENFESKNISKQKSDLITALSFDTFLSHKSLKTIPDYKLSGDVFRIVAPAYDVWSIAGSLADGGRFNIGGAQQCQQLPHLKKYAGLYVSSDLACAEAEAAKPLGAAKAYKLTLKKELTLWDLNKVLEEIDHPNLKDLLNGTPIDAIWGFQKIPLVSQILASLLRSQGGNGIIFPSVKLPTANNIALFFSSDSDAKSSFEVEEILLSNL